MPITGVITTLAGAFIFPFIIKMVWDKLVQECGLSGGFAAGALIVGTTWTLNHGVGLIYQSGAVWVDMGFAAFSGLFFASCLNEDCIKEGGKTAFFAILGGAIGGLILSCL